nr:hypothetical protein BaRGS_020159 [Batillaria attramentaria]
MSSWKVCKFQTGTEPFTTSMTWALAVWTTPTKVDVGKFASLSKLQELRLRGVSGLALPTFTFSGKLTELTSLQHLHTLSLTSLCALRDSEFHFLSEMKQLEVVELGDCLNWSSEPALVNSHAMAAVENLQQLDTLEWGVVIRDEGKGSDPAAHDSQIGRKNSIPLLKPDNGDIELIQPVDTFSVPRLHLF